MDMDFKQKKVLFLVPNLRWSGKRVWMYLPYAALILTTLLKDEFDFRIIDANGGNLSEEVCAQKIREFRPDVVMVSAHSVEYHQVYHKTISVAKTAYPQAAVVLGGVYPTVLGEEAVKDRNIDYIFMGHAENRVVEFLKLLLVKDFEGIQKLPGIGYLDPSGQPVLNPITSYLVDTQKTTKLDYSLVDLTPYLRQDIFDFHFNSAKRTTYILTSYGCLYNCVFCASRTICGRGIVFRPIEEVLEEIDFLVSQYGVESIVFFDELFLADRKRSETLLNSLLERKYNLEWKVGALSAWLLDDQILELMKRSGCTNINISVESGCQATLEKIIHKPLKLDTIPGIVRKCKELELNITASFVIGFPGETWDAIRETFRYAESLNFDAAYFHVATPLPKTELYEIAKQQKLLPDDFNFLDPKFFGFGQGFITTKEFTPFELMVLRAFEYDRINFSSPEKIEKFAKMCLTTVDKVNEHRRETRRKLGVHF